MPGAAIPLVALRGDLDSGWPPDARWRSRGEPGAAALDQPAGTVLRFPLSCEGTRFEVRGRARIAQAAGRHGTVRLRVLLLGGSGRERTLADKSIRHLGNRFLPSQAEFDAAVSANEGSLALEVKGAAGTVVRWEGMELSLRDDAAAVGAAPIAAEPPRPPLPLEAEAEAEGGEGPLISILTPVHDPDPEVLAETLASVAGQSFEDWELCLVDDGSRDPRIRAALAAHVAGEKRARLVRDERAGGIAAATNRALEMARGRFVALLDHDDLLQPDALAEIARTLRDHPDADMLYTDEEVFEPGRPGFTFAKPHWSPDLLRSQMYACHLGVYRRALVEEVGGFDPAFDGSQDFDLALRVAERARRIVHVPRTLYRWRAHSGSSAQSTAAKPAAYTAARRAIAAHLRRTGVDADVHFGPWQGVYRVVHRLPAGTAVAVAAVGDSGAAETLRASVAAADAGVGEAKVIAAADVASAAAAGGEADVVVICEQPVEPLSRLWLSRLAAFALQPGVAAVGAKVLAPDGRVEHDGLAIVGGVPIPLMVGAAAADPGPLGVGILPSNRVAVSGVVAIPGERLRAHGGLDRDLEGLAIVDYCLRAVAAGDRVVAAPDVIMRRLAPPAPSTDLVALERLRARWAGRFATDPYFDMVACWPGVETGPG